MQRPEIVFANTFAKILIPAFISFLAYRHYQVQKFAEGQKYQTFNPRFLAGVADAVISRVFSLFIAALLVLAPSPFLKGALLFLLAFGVLFYQIILHAMYGQTVGKMICKVKVIDWKSGASIGLKQAFLRDGILLVLSVLILIGGGPAPMMMGVYFLWFLAEILTMLTNEKRRSLHDLIAGTVVVRTNIDSTLIFEGNSIIDPTTTKFLEVLEKYKGKTTEELNSIVQKKVGFSDRAIYIAKQILREREATNG